MSHHPERTARNVRPVNQPPSIVYAFGMSLVLLGAFLQFVLICAQEDGCDDDMVNHVGVDTDSKMIGVHHDKESII